MSCVSFHPLLHVSVQLKEIVYAAYVSFSWWRSCFYCYIKATSWCCHLYLWKRQIKIDSMMQARGFFINNALVSMGWEGGHTWHLIGWRLNGESLWLAWILIWILLSNPGPWCYSRHDMKHLCYLYQMHMLSLTLVFGYYEYMGWWGGKAAPCYIKWNFVSLALTHWSSFIWCFVVFL